MTDKQIIIDGVDVSGCPHYILKDGSCSSQDCECVKCVHNVCFYKSYKAKEQECEELKAELELFKTSNQTTINQLKAENETLFKAIEEVNKINKRFESENEELKKELQKYKDNEQQEKEMQKLYNKFEGSSLIEKSVTNEQRP